MKIRYKKILRSTSLDQSVLIYNILVALDKPGYDITKQTENCIEFKTSFWRPEWNFKAIWYIDGGTFDIDSKNKTISFSFYLSPLLDILLNLFALTLVITQGFQLLYFNVFLGVMLVIRLISVRILAYEMMEKVVSLE